MKNIFSTLMLLLIMILSCACGAEKSTTASKGSASEDAVSFIQTGASLPAYEPQVKIFTASDNAADVAEARRHLDELAELERSGSWFSGMAVTESSLHERLGDFAGAVAAAYKEISYGYGKGLIQKEDIERGILNLRNMKNEDINAAVDTILAFIRGQWDDAASDLSLLFSDDEPDGFGSWMILVCALENGQNSKETFLKAAAMYKAIRARYVNFPEYWYRGARAFSGLIAVEFAENCIATAPEGPFAPECRTIIAAQSNISKEDAQSIKTKQEIDAVISQSVKSGNPEILDSLLPLIALPDNPYTLYAVNSLRSLSVTQKYNEYFGAKTTASKGRLKERLNHICRG